MILLIDNYDSFTYNLADYLRQLGTTVMVRRNDALTVAAIRQHPPQGILLSPGPSRPEQAGITPAVVAACGKDIPILGVCLGYHAIGQHFGARVIEAPQPVHGKTSPVHHNGHPLFAGIPKVFRATRYHSLVLDCLNNTPLNVLAHTDDAFPLPMAVAHPKYPVSGVQFHPEAILTEHGLRLLRNWLQCVNHWKKLQLSRPALR